MKTANSRACRVGRMALTAASVLATTAAAQAHGVGIDATNWTRTWTFDPGVIAGLFFTGAVYLSGLTWLRRATSTPHKLRGAAWSFGAGWLLVAIALISPVHAWSEVLFSAHMVQHELLMVAAAPLLVLGRPGLVSLWALPPTTARRLAAFSHARGVRQTWRTLAHPFVAWLVFALTLWIWHVPQLFDATLDHPFIHAAQHLCFLGSALWFWHAVFFGPQRRASYGLAIVYLFTTALHSGALGALITFAGVPWYVPYEATASWWGYTPLEDQQLGGIIMWVPAGLTYIVAALALFAAWLRECERRNPVIPFPPAPTCAPSP